eukprot:m.150253 g.150253  ORF g.150253 m.150253 type:complete len:2376 (-) comp16169_c0_seq1:102-7229(-)
MGGDNRSRRLFKKAQAPRGGGGKQQRQDGDGRKSKFSAADLSLDRDDERDVELDYLESKLDRLVKTALADDRMDAQFGFQKYVSGPPRLGWLLNMQSTVYRDAEGKVRSAVDFYFMEEDGGRFKVAFPYLPYFYIKVKPNTEIEVEQYLKRKFDVKIAAIDRVDKEDLSLPNHLVGLKQLYLKLSFLNVHDLMHVKSKLSPQIRKNQQRNADSLYSNEAFETVGLSKGRGMDEDEDEDNHAQAGQVSGATHRKHVDDVLDNVIDIREYDVPYHMRVSIDKKIVVAKWYDVRIATSEVLIIERPDKLLRPDPIVLAWDIETTKLPLKFPDMETDQIMMISYMIDGQGYLIINREIVSEDIEDFEYTPKPEFPGPFIVFNVADELATISRFFEHIREVKPHIMATYNGDLFDWPFLERRSEILGLNMFQQIGFRPDSQGEYKSRFAPHMDCFRWVKRDSYLPVGSQGLKAVTRAKLRYDPLEIHYEEICRMAAQEPQQLANYSVSDAVATYYLFMKYVNPFIFALCTIIPLGPDDVLRKGSGTLCESLLMDNAYHANIIMPNKKQADLNKLYNGRLVDSETYIGGHVEALESGVFRDDIPCRFRIVPAAVQTLIDNLDNALRYAIEVEEKRDFATITNYEEVKAEIQKRLEDLRDNPYRQEVPLIYHLDVAAMYPNIILTNRLQPPAMVDETMCAACAFNKPESNCQRKMQWKWRGEISPASRHEYELIRTQLESEVFPSSNPDEAPRAFHELNTEEQADLVKKRLHAYSRRVYKKTHVTMVEDRISTICQRENPFYIDTVRNFRDRRYVFKAKHKDAKKNYDVVAEQNDPVKLKEMSNLVVLYDSLQLAHKCILNSFYGYVMRKGARWYSMEMAGIVCLTGANIITKAREIVEQIGRPLELDTDGIWCCLPGSFPERVVFKTTEPGKKSECEVSYPGAMLNMMVKEHFTNDQYQDLINPETLEYETKVVNSIFFEVDGPYKAMILPASKEKDKKLKKRYAVFDKNGALCELKGFEIKRNGELKLIKIFQSSVFDAFLQGTNLQEVYESVATVADHWLDILYSRGEGLAAHELFDLISENRSMSRTLKEYEGQKSTSISTAKRLAEFLGPDMVKDKGLACQFVISKKPEGAPVTERAIPVAIFQAEESVRKYYLRKWTKEGNRLISFDIRDILDWDYYIERLGSAIQKIITIPAALQKVSNPVPRVPHPDWLQARLLEKADTMKQQRITDLLRPGQRPAIKPSMMDEQRDTEGDGNTNESSLVGDIEDQFNSRPSGNAKRPTVTIHRRVKQKGKNRLLTEEVTTQHWREALGPPPDPAAGYAEWLTFQKKKWKIQLAQRKLRKEMGVSADTVRAFGTGANDGASAHRKALTMAQFLQKQRANISSTHWEIIQIAETREPGIMRVWCMVAGDLHCMRLNIPRRFYANLRTPDTSGKRERVNRILPRFQPAYHLYEFRMSEREFLQKQRALTSTLSHPDVVGVYEMHIPLLWQAVVQLGCVAVLRPQAAKDHRPGDDFDLDDLQGKTITSCSYLSSTVALHRVFLFHSATGTRAVYGVFFGHLGRAAIIVVDPGNNQTGVPNMSKLWRECFAERIAALQDKRDKVDAEELDLVIPPEKIKFDVFVETTNSRAHRRLALVLEEYRDAQHGPSLLIVQTPLRLDVLQADVPVVGEFPIIQAASSASMNQYPALNWQKDALQVLLSSFAVHQEWFLRQLDAARYAHVPIGNLPADHHTFICDVFFARQLRKQNFLLWASPSHRPDLGGKEEDDNRLMADESETAHWELNNPGVYETTCVDIQLGSLPMAAVLHADHIHDVENGSAIAASFDSNPTSSLEDMVQQKQAYELTMFDESAQCKPAFRVLRMMLNTWLKEVVNYGNPHADDQLVHFYRWLKSPDSFLYDPALLRLVRGLMKKLFLQLIAKLQSLGSEIVFASFSRLLLKTSKTNQPEAENYMHYILDVLKKQESFRILWLRPVMYWDHLVWMDVENYGGIDALALRNGSGASRDLRRRRLAERLSGKSGIESPRKRAKRDGTESDHVDDEEEDGAPLRHVHDNAMLFDDEEEDNVPSQLPSSQPQAQMSIEMHWNIAAYLPVEDCQQAFEHILGEWIYRSYDARRKARLERGGIGLTPIKRRSSGTQASADELAMEIRQTLTKALMHAVSQINMKMPGDARAKGQSVEFPVLPGSHLPLKHPALEFTKAVTQVLSLDKKHASEIARLKRDLLRLIGVREFSPEAKFKDPCLSFVLSEVVCTYCNACRDLDLCRDDNVTVDANEVTAWRCTECMNQYDREAIEQQLIDHVNQKMMMYQLQDLRCIKCKQVKDSNMHQFCDCSGSFATASTTREELWQKLHTMQSIARSHKLEMLDELTTWALALIPI